MKTRVLIYLACLLLGTAGAVPARPARTVHELAEPNVDADIVGDTDATHPAPQKTLQDTVWIADWTFDDPSGACVETGWVKVDNHIRNDGNVYWYVTGRYAGTGVIVGDAAVMGYVNNVCCGIPDGYDNDWYQGIRITYQGAATISFVGLVDSESGFDFVNVESDSACASFDRVDYATAPSKVAVNFRDVDAVADGYNIGLTVTNHALVDYGSGTHCAYISFFADGGFSPCDGYQQTTLGAGCVIDDISITDAGGTRAEDFADAVLDMAGASFVNMQDSKMLGPPPSGSWARTYQHITDNDLSRRTRRAPGCGPTTRRRPSPTIRAWLSAPGASWSTTGWTTPSSAPG